MGRAHGRSPQLIKALWSFVRDHQGISSANLKSSGLDDLAAQRLERPRLQFSGCAGIGTQQTLNSQLVDKCQKPRSPFVPEHRWFGLRSAKEGLVLPGATPRARRLPAQWPRAFSLSTSAIARPDWGAGRRFLPPRVIWTAAPRLRYAGAAGQDCERWYSRTSRNARPVARHRSVRDPRRRLPSLLLPTSPPDPLRRGPSFPCRAWSGRSGLTAQSIRSSARFAFRFRRDAARTTPEAGRSAPRPPSWEALLLVASRREGGREVHRSAVRRDLPGSRKVNSP